MKKTIITLVMTALMSFGAAAQNSDIQLTQQWDKTFPKSEKVNRA